MGNSEQQDRSFDFFETGHGIVDAVVTFSALAVFTWFGSGLSGFKAGIWFYSLIMIAIGIIIFFVLNDREEAPFIKVKEEDGASQNTSMTSMLRDRTIWLIAFNVSFVYTAYCDPTFFISLLKNIYLLPVALMGTYGITSQYYLEMTGGPIGGMISGKILGSSSKYLCCTSIIGTAALILLIILPHESMPVYSGMAYTLDSGAIVFTQRVIFFAPIGEAEIAENKTGAAMALGNFIGYASVIFCFSLYGCILDLNLEIISYKTAFGIIACFAFCGAVVSVVLVKCINQRRKEMSAAEA